MNIEALQDLTVWILPVLFTLTMREAARAYAAKWCGDRTGEMMGRVTFNPLPHIDPVGTLLVPALGVLTHSFLFGWAKPVPVELRGVRHARRDMVLVSLAGPGMTLLTSREVFTQISYADPATALAYPPAPALTVTAAGRLDTTIWHQELKAGDLLIRDTATVHPLTPPREVQPGDTANLLTDDGWDDAIPLTIRRN